MNWGIALDIFLPLCFFLLIGVYDDWSTALVLAVLFGIGATLLWIAP